MNGAEAGNPDELAQMLTNWLNQANDPIGSLPAGVTPNEWVAKNFIDSWQKPIRAGLDEIETSLNRALEALKAGNVPKATFEIECSLQTLGDDIRGELGLYEWNRGD